MDRGQRKERDREKINGSFSSDRRESRDREKIKSGMERDQRKEPDWESGERKWAEKK